MPQSLYRRVLGDELDLLPEPMRRFHDAERGAKASGHFTVTRGAGWFRNGLASLIGLPVAGVDVPTKLSVDPSVHRECWVRRFGDHPMKTVQWQAENLLIEAGGPLRFGFKLIADHTSLEFELVRAWFCFVPLPRFARPQIRAIETACEDGWNVVVEMSLPVIGMMIRYGGRVQPDDVSPSTSPP